MDAMESMPMSAMAYPNPVTNICRAEPAVAHHASAPTRRVLLPSSAAQATTRIKKQKAGRSSRMRPVTVWAWRGTSDDPATNATKAPQPV